ncbi:hypothetical protein J5N97_024805 [Dioscorea zingiberensis]|uniref:Uncharacterized protein n=1 Tax=Dioscorea zingiberensis TaxID=325984 RepID=A0A9D5C7Y3_9LILI|nr:hypothetical protein J5N97_024805 [Dioscorea zingiberensis]
MLATITDAHNMEVSGLLQENTNVLDLLREPMKYVGFSDPSDGSLWLSPSRSWLPLSEEAVSLLECLQFVSRGQRRRPLAMDAHHRPVTAHREAHRRYPFEADFQIWWRLELHCCCRRRCGFEAAAADRAFAELLQTAIKKLRATCYVVEAFGVAVSCWVLWLNGQSCCLGSIFVAGASFPSHFRERIFSDERILLGSTGALQESTLSESVVVSSSPSELSIKYDDAKDNLPSESIREILREDDFPEVKVNFQEIFLGHTSPISKCRFSASRTNLASISIDGTVRIWTYDSSFPGML